MHPRGTCIRLDLLLNACDIPAARKTSGFTSHASLCACHKCAHQFSVFPGTTNIDYSGFDVENWELRRWDANRLYAEQWRNADTMAARRELERQNGTRWSELHCLEYFDPVRSTIIDPMHNLFLGTAKRMVTVWIKNNLITDIFDRNHHCNAYFISVYVKLNKTQFIQWSDRAFKNDV